ncbi:MAG: RIP metalloprotease RseP [Alphaproteobacteria bacterium]|nr:RIP metalloprotease RseP [Alphaproteobacteria bacterium]
MHTLATLFHYAWSFALIISIIVFVHEYGHFLAARLLGVKVETFSIGFGRELLGRTDRHGTRWRIALFPLGGYVKMFGDASAASTPDKAQLQTMGAAERKQSLHHQPLWAKSIIVAAGPLANFLLTIAVLTYFLYTVGIASTQPVVGEVMPNTPAASAGLQPGDRIAAIDGKPMRRFNDIPEALVTNLYTPVTLTVQRGGETLTLLMTPIEYAEKDISGNIAKRPLIGIRSQQLTREDVSFPRAVWLATERTYAICATNLRALGQIIMGERSAKNLTGTLGIAKLSGDITQQGETARETLMTLLWFIAMISAGIGLVNLFPLPMLDGGHLMFYAIEGLMGRPLPDHFTEYSYRLGFAMIMLLMAFTLFNDARKIFFS